jgi:hypothetical protein
MNTTDLDFVLPGWDFPDTPSSRLAPDAYLRWLNENRLALVRSGKLESLRADPERRPVDASFVIE